MHERSEAHVFRMGALRPPYKMYVPCIFYGELKQELKVVVWGVDCPDAYYDNTKMSPPATTATLPSPTRQCLSQAVLCCNVTDAVGANSEF